MLKKIITVDNSSTTDRDDWLSYNPETWLLGIHITIAPAFNKEKIKLLNSTTYDNYEGKIIQPMIENYEKYSLDKWETREVLSVYIDKTLEVKDIKKEEVFVDNNYAYTNFDQDKCFSEYNEFYNLLFDKYVNNGYKEFDFEDIRVLWKDKYEIRKSYLTEKIIAMFATTYNNILTQKVVWKNNLFFVMINPTNLDEHIKSRRQFFDILSDLHRSEMTVFNPIDFKEDEYIYNNKLLWLDIYWRFTSPLRRLDDYINQQIYLWNIKYDYQEISKFIDKIDYEQQDSKQQQLLAKKMVVLNDIEVWKKYNWIVTWIKDFWTFITFWDDLEFNWLAYQKFTDKKEVEIIVNNYDKTNGRVWLRIL